MRSLGRALMGLGLAAAAAGGVALALIFNSDFATERALLAVFTVGVGWSFIGTGLFAWWRRPDNRTGALMTATGFAWLLQALMAANSDVLFALGYALGPLGYGLLIHMVIAFPEGRLTTRAQRRLMALVWFVVTIGQWLIVPFIDPHDFPDCSNCPGNPFLVTQDDTIANVLSGIQTLLAVAGLAGVIVVLVQRYRAAPRAQRQTLGPVFWAGGLGMVATAMQLAVATTGVSHQVEQAFYIVSITILASVPFAFLFGLLRTRLTRAGAVGDLMSRVGERRESLRDALADAFGDPTLELAYWLPDRERYVDAAGRRVELPVPGSGRAWTPVARDREPLAAIVHDAALADERELLDAAGAAAALTLENERLDAELRARVEELSRSRERLLEVGLAERRALERNLHDGAQQRLIALALNLRMARGKLDDDPDGAGALLDDAMAELLEATDELRELARGIHPAVLSDRGLHTALDALAGRAPVPVDVVETPDQSLPAPVEAVAYYVVAEALTNVARYARASRAEVSVRRQNGRVMVRVSDDGVGGADPAGGTGLRGLADRLAAFDGRLDVESPQGEGTTIRAQIPCG